MSLADEAFASKKKPMKRLTCRKCEGHGVISILKGHAPACQFNDCKCDTCSSVMNMRANALIRRFRHRQPGQNAAVLRTIRSKNGNMRLRILPKGEHPNDPSATMITYTEDSAQMSSPDGSGSSSPMLPALSPSLLSTSPIPGADLFMMEYIQQLLNAQFISEMIMKPEASTTAFTPVVPSLSPLIMQSFLFPQMMLC